MANSPNENDYAAISVSDRSLDIRLRHLAVSLAASDGKLTADETATTSRLIEAVLTLRLAHDMDTSVACRSVELRS